MKGQTVIDQLKIRASYGQTGKVNFPPYVARTTYKMFTDVGIKPVSVVPSMLWGIQT